MWILFVFGAAALAGIVIFIGNREESRKQELRNLQREEVNTKALEDDPKRRREIALRRKPKNN